MEINCLIVGQLATNCYLVWDEKSRHTVIIDPGDDADFIINKIQDLQLLPEFILTTHGHFDHVLAVTEIRLAYKIPFLMHQADMFLLKRTGETARYFTSVGADPLFPPDKFIAEGNQIKLGQECLKVMETPGHTPGGVSLYNKKGDLFTGDTLFAHGVGRTDYSYGSEELLLNSIKKILRFPASTKVYPGHGEETTLRAVDRSLSEYFSPILISQKQKSKDN